MTVGSQAVPTNGIVTRDVYLRDAKVIAFKALCNQQEGAVFFSDFWGCIFLVTVAIGQDGRVIEKPGVVEKWW